MGLDVTENTIEGLGLETWPIPGRRLLCAGFRRGLVREPEGMGRQMAHEYTDENVLHRIAWKARDKMAGGCALAGSPGLRMQHLWVEGRPGGALECPAVLGCSFRSAIPCMERAATCFHRSAVGSLVRPDRASWPSVMRFPQRLARGFSADHTRPRIGNP